MPYIVETLRSSWHPSSDTPVPSTLERQAVATLDEARAVILTELGDLNAIAGPEDDLCGAVLDFSESGGTIGPLPDGTVIEVRRISWGDLRKAAAPLPRPTVRPAVIMAFNAIEENRS